MVSPLALSILMCQIEEVISCDSVVITQLSAYIHSCINTIPGYRMLLGTLANRIVCVHGTDN